ncbi:MULTISPECIES: glutaminase A [Mycolicibacter]|uniref:Glutaminase n=1 Tax=Mycolicibacter virginiensis TaxID=1795032 RepID=A0A9X7IRA8_9MYCO|nr:MULTISPECIES: glutaminase A [Mycobacteriaceae]OBG32749.1 glutaminase A [Mycolicibacter heraklionensis]OBJ28439.1 glutaminase A [Mycolicibacter heraklionensis]PQM53946.1 glutaminase A [Mycolicibacter virginiensis]ULP48879.1 glutaminase A [Mycolicibacter virginiensis]
MAALVQRYLDGILAEHAGVGHGALASYIPELAEVDPTGFGLALSSSDGYVYESGDADVQFTMQSISKPFTYALALDQLGQTDVDARIGVEPSGEGFNKISVDQVTNVPKNPMINAGAIVACSLIPGKTSEDRFDLVRDFFSACAGRSLDFDEAVYQSERASGSRNRGIAYLLESFGALGADPDDALDLYIRQCSLKVTSTDLARMAATLARGGLNPLTGRQVTDAAVVRRTLSVMVTCGMYDAAGAWVSAVGMPAKSGVAGGIVAVLPGQLGIGVYSPRIDAKGNSVRGMLVCRSLSQQLGLHFLTVSSEAHAAIRGVYTPRPGIRVYEVHGDLLFAGAEQVARTATRECGEFDTAILDVSRLHTISEPARGLLAGLSEELRALDKQGLLVDPNGSVTPDPDAYAGLVFATVEDALAATETWVGE